jgi:ribA/ribD-fused uncharacterized protein
MEESAMTDALVKALENPSVIQKLKDSQTSVIQNELSKYKAENKVLSMKVTKLENDMDNLEQYSRRNSLRIYGIIEEDKENIYEVLSDLFKEKLGLVNVIQTNDIDRAHRLGARKAVQIRPIIVKFSTYQARQKVFSSKRNLKTYNETAENKIFINEDLTPRRANLLYAARQLKNSGKLGECWSYDGSIVVKDCRGRIEEVRDHKDLDKFKTSMHHRVTHVSPHSTSVPISLPVDQSTPASTEPNLILQHDTTELVDSAAATSGTESTSDDFSSSNLSIPPSIDSTQPNTELKTNKKINIEITNATKILKDGTICFMSQDAPLSNWYRADITVNDIVYNCNEQYYFAMMATAAKDNKSFLAIMGTDDPSQQKKLGSKIKGNIDDFDDLRTMKTAVEAKFTQNKYLREYLLETGEAPLCEATSSKFWAIGVTLNSRDLSKKAKWVGANHLGKILMQQRDQLKDDDLYS